MRVWAVHGLRARWGPKPSTVKGSGCVKGYNPETNGYLEPRVVLPVPQLGKAESVYEIPTQRCGSAFQASA